MSDVGKIGPVIEARYDGRCGICDDKIWTGDEIRMVDGEPAEEDSG